MIETYNVIGLMSGTSLDGLDLAFCSFQNDGSKWTFDLKSTKSIDYDDKLRQRLKASIDLPAMDLLMLNKEYGQWLGHQVRSFVNEFDLRPDFVASHGHTVHHQPQKGITYQIGAGQEIANICGIQVICDFRSKDVSLGGQGAPLVPVGDMYLFSEYHFCLNLGGISNVSFDYEGNRIAYDIGLANMVLNHITDEINLSYDEGGQIARSGNLDQQLFDRLNALPYYHQPFPKSTGYEWFVEEVMPLMDNSNLSTEDKLCSAAHHVAYTIAYDIKQFSKGSDRMLVTGGGAKNSFLMEVLKHYLKGCVAVNIPDHRIIEFKESIVFAFLGVLRVRGEANCLRSVTGASADSCGGVIFEPV